MNREQARFLLIFIAVGLTTAMPILGGVLFPGVAQAQIATSNLTPGLPYFILSDFPGPSNNDRAGINNTSFTPHNPAAIQWSPTSKIGAGNIDGASEQTDPSGTQARVHGGGFGGALFVGEYAALSVARITASETNQDFTKTFESTNFQFSLKLGDTLAVGVGRENTSVEKAIEILPSVFNPILNEIELTSYGVAFNFNKWLFLGYAQGTRKLTVTLPATGVTQVIGEGNFTKKGVALRTLGDWKWYLEHFILDFQAIENAPGSGIKTTTDAFQVNIHGVLIGFSVTEMEMDQDLALPSLEQIVETSTVELGWVPDQGLAYSFRLVTVQSDGRDPIVPANNFSETIKSTSFAVSYLF